MKKYKAKSKSAIKREIERDIRKRMNHYDTTDYCHVKSTSRFSEVEKDGIDQVTSDLKNKFGQDIEIIIT